MTHKRVQFSSKYSKSYSSMANAEKAIDNLSERLGCTVRWIPSVDSETPDRIIPVVIVGADDDSFDAIHLGFAIAN